MEDIALLEERIEEYKRVGDYNKLVKFLQETIPQITSLEKKLTLKIELAEAYYTNRNFKESKEIVEQILHKASEEKYQSLIGHCENLLGKIYRIHQRYTEAIKHYQNGEEAFKAINNRDGLTKIYHNLGNVFVYIERFKEAKKYHNKSLKLAQELGNPYSIGSSHLNIGAMYYQNGEVDSALNHLTKAITIFEEIKDEPSLAAAYLNLSEVHFLRQDFQKAYQMSSKAFTLYEKQQNLIGKRLSLNVSAKTERASGSFTKAIEIYNQIISLDNIVVPEDTYIELGECYLVQKQLEEAKKSFEEVLQLSSRTDRGIGISLDYLAKIAIDRKEYDTARKLYIQLLELLNRMKPKDNDSIASTQGNLGFIYLKLGNIKQAWKLLETTTQFFEKRKNWEELLTLSSNFRDEFVKLKEFEKARTIVQDYLLPVSKKNKNFTLQNQLQYEVALLMHLAGKTDEGVNYWKKNYNKKVSFPKFKTQFLNTPIIPQKLKLELENQHIIFMKKLKEVEN